MGINPTTEWRLKRFLAKVDKTDSCWVWRGYIAPNGYGRFGHDYKSNLAHRFVFEALVRKLEPGEQLDHLCRNRACVNPEHLEAVSAQENVLRGQGIAAANARKTSCINGHEYSKANLYVDPRGGRQCRSCRREASRKWKEA